MAILYNALWYQKLNEHTLELRQDTVTEAAFPSVAMIERNDWTSQAHLLPNFSKCFIGWYKNSAPSCGTSGGPTLPCNCSDAWTQDVVEDLEWQNTSYRYLEFSAPPSLISQSPTTIMILQSFFWYNSTQAFFDSSQNLQPSIWVAIYDRKFTLKQALEKGYTRMILINANGMTAINLGLEYRQALNEEPAYDYSLSISTIPAQDLVCDVSSRKQTASGPCHTSLFLQIPTFDRRISLQSYAMKWTDMIGSAGAYFSFVQLLSWILSGAAFTT
ncbi:uncharacterized protein K452DRAFT_89052 [Aplosporella prunicola CBS 121167]|uniref:Uncharacterized protein n=1 Tax=Aplosporella prunicola CBS 121167 TaxID=1176127 RepID=A0A6A6B452_9PEZI|nr:uncharacterized protein K452DRAFT_89052 [Aplosporella prunicola CBS 121167]KAF2138606.1 hypothetical protein K452DRAFT_89052 [Aplosporella prunicola CBS 121167]